MRPGNPDPPGLAEDRRRFGLTGTGHMHGLHLRAATGDLVFMLAAPVEQDFGRGPDCRPVECQLLVVEQGLQPSSA